MPSECRYKPSESQTVHPIPFHSPNTSYIKSNIAILQPIYKSSKSNDHLD